MKKISILLSVFMTMGLLAACQFGLNITDTSVTVYSERHYDTDRLLYEQFEAETGIAVNLVRGSADELIMRMKNEGEDSPADLLIIADAGRLHRAKTEDLLQSVDSDILVSTIPEIYRDSDLTWFGLTRRARVIVYHPDRVNESELSTYEALTDPQWHGRVVTRTSTNIYNQSLMASFIEIQGEEEAKTFAEGLVANFARDPEGNDRDQAKTVAAGEADVAIMNTYYIGRMLHSSDPHEVTVAETINVFFPNQETTGTHVNISAAGVAKHASNPEYAVRLIEFLVSESAQRQFADANFEYPINPEVEPHALLQSWGDFKAQNIPLTALGIHAHRAVIIMNEAGWK